MPYRYLLIFPCKMSEFGSSQNQVVKRVFPLFQFYNVPKPYFIFYDLLQTFREFKFYVYCVESISGGLLTILTYLTSNPNGFIWIRFLFNENSSQRTYFPRLHEFFYFVEEILIKIGLCEVIYRNSFFMVLLEKI